MICLEYYYIELTSKHFLLMLKIVICENILLIHRKYFFVTSLLQLSKDFSFTCHNENESGYNA